MINLVNPDYIANQIRMTRTQHHGLFVIIEGKSGDLRFYGKFVDQTGCMLIVGNGKDNVLGALRILEADGFLGVIGIVDADFWRVEQIENRDSNLFLTDSHDVETMILQSPALDNLLMEFGTEDRVKNLKQTHKAEDVREILLKTGSNIGYLRLLSLRNKYSLKFKGLRYRNFLNELYLIIDIKKLIQEVKRTSTNCSIADETLREEVERLAQSNEHSLWEICCGHDLVEILSIGLCSALGCLNPSQIAPKELEKILRLSFDTTHFAKTELYRSLRNWEKQNASFRIFPVIEDVTLPAAAPQTNTP